MRAALVGLWSWVLFGLTDVSSVPGVPEPHRPHHEPEPPEKCPKCGIGSFLTIRHPDKFKAAKGVRLGKCRRKRCGWMARLTPKEE